MKEGYRLLGDFIQPVDARNRDLKVDYLLGVSISKQFIPSIANIVGTDLSSYKIVRSGQFAYGPVTSRNGEKISIALLRDKDCIISSSYTVFEVVNKNALDPEYLMLWFSRSEFDRYARYMSHGSVREIFGWDEMRKVELPVPSIEKQRSIVRAYQTITERIELKRRINDNLEATGSTLYRQTFESFGDTLPIGWRIHHLSEYLPVITGKKDANTTSPDGQYPFFSCSQDILWTEEYSFEADAILVAGNGDFNVKNYSGKFEAYQRTYVLIPQNELFCGWLYYVVKHHLPKATTAARGSVISFITKGMLENIAFAVPDDFDELRLFCEKANAIVKAIRVNNSEILELQRIQLIVLEQLSR